VAPIEKLSPELIYTQEEKGKVIDLSLNGNIQPVILDGDPQVKLNNNMQSLKMGDIYLQGPFWSSIEGSEGSLDNIQPDKPWPTANHKPWQKYPGWRNGELYYLPADLNTAYYALQEIESPREQSILTRVTSGDGVVMWLNGKQIFIHNNPFKSDSIDHVIKLNLQPGKNQLVVKLFSHFKKQTPFGIDFQVPQTLFSKKFLPITITPAKPFEIRWKLHQPFTPHEDIGLPNLELIIRHRKGLKLQ